MRTSIAALAPAKLNLALSVGPPAPAPAPGGRAPGSPAPAPGGCPASDPGVTAVGSAGPPVRGMHPICSWMVTVDLYDELLVTRLEPDRLSRYAILWHPEARRRSDINWPIAKDLAVRAHLALEVRAGRRLPVQLKLEKRIPVGGGLGGGSSDAAAMLRAVNELFELGLSLDELAAVGATLGSDVPFLVHGGSAIVEGTGEKVTRLEPATDVHAVIAFPGAACPTARVYALFDEAGTARLRPEAVRRIVAAPLEPASPFNDLAASAARAAPGLARVLEDLAALAARPAHVSGSGSSVFVLCDDPLHAAALARIAEAQLGLPAVAARAVDRAAPVTI